jgi:hypothetical protein
MDIDSDVLRPVFEFIMAAYTRPPAPGLRAAYNASEVFLTTVWPGTLLDHTYEDAWSPLNPKGIPAVTGKHFNSSIPSQVLRLSIAIGTDRARNEAILRAPRNPHGMSFRMSEGTATGRDGYPKANGATIDSST